MPMKISLLALATSLTACAAQSDVSLFDGRGQTLPSPTVAAMNGIAPQWEYQCTTNRLTDVRTCAVYGIMQVRGQTVIVQISRFRDGYVLLASGAPGADTLGLRVDNLPAVTGIPCGAQCVVLDAPAAMLVTQMGQGRNLYLRFSPGPEADFAITPAFQAALTQLRGPQAI